MLSSFTHQKFLERALESFPSVNGLVVIAINTKFGFYDWPEISLIRKKRFKKCIKFPIFICQEWSKVRLKLPKIVKRESIRFEINFA